MTTRTKLTVCMYTASAMLFLNLFSYPLHIPEKFQWVLMLGVFIPLGLVFYFIKQIKREKAEISQATNTPTVTIEDQKSAKRKKLFLLMLIASVSALSTPIWMPFTGSSLGLKGDFTVGFMLAVIICIYFGLMIKKQGETP